MSSSEEANAPQTINIDSMSLEELNQLKQREEGRLQSLSSKMMQFQQAAGRLNASKMAVQELSPSSEGKPLLIPLTESVYAPARVRNPETLLVELGTGYYCEKTQKETLEFLDRKLKLVNVNSENVTKAAQATRQNVQAVTQTMQGKLLEIRAKQEGARYMAKEESK